MPQNIAGLTAYSKDEVDILSKPFPLTIQFSRHHLSSCFAEVDGGSFVAPETLHLSDDQMVDIATKLEAYLNEVVVPHVIETNFDKVMQYQPVGKYR